MSDNPTTFSSYTEVVPPPPALPLDYLYDMRPGSNANFTRYQPFEDWCRTFHMPTCNPHGDSGSYTFQNTQDPVPNLLPDGATLGRADGPTSNPRYMYLSYHMIASEMYRYFARNHMPWPDSFHFTIPVYINSNFVSSAMLTPCYKSGDDLRADYAHFQFPDIFNNMRPINPPAPATFRFTHQIRYTAIRDREPTSISLCYHFLTDRPLPFMPYAAQYFDINAVKPFRDMLSNVVPRLTAISPLTILPAHHPYLSTIATDGFTETNATLRLIAQYDSLTAAQRAILSPGLLFNMIAKSARRADPNDFAEAVKSQCEPGTDDMLERYGPDIFVRIYQHLSDLGWPDLEDILESANCDNCCGSDGCGDCAHCHTQARVEELEQVISDVRHSLDNLKDELDV